VNGDGFDDLIIGAYYADAGGGNSGETYVVFGKSGGFSSALDLSSLDGSNGFRLDGIDVDDNSSRSVSRAGDVNGDGRADAFVAPGDRVQRFKGRALAALAQRSAPPAGDAVPRGRAAPAGHAVCSCGQTVADAPWHVRA